MARPSKSADVLAAEGKSHRTKAEMQQRKDAEKAAISGIRIRESGDVKNDEVAHQEFRRVRALLSAVGKNDALFEATINDYCMLKSDISRCTEMRRAMERDLEEVEKLDIELEEIYSLRNDIRKNMLSYERQIAALKKKRFEIEKESGFTISSALRAIPKKPEKEENPLLKALRGDE